MAHPPLRPIAALLVPFLLAHCGSRSSARPDRRIPESAAPEVPRPQIRICDALVSAIRAAEARCGCPSGEDDLEAQCAYHLFPSYDEGEVHEVALARCLSDLNARLGTCAQTRIPARCAPSLLASVSSDVAFDLPEGSDCRRANGDEGFEAHFLCAEGLVCTGTCSPVDERPCATNRDCADDALCVRDGDEGRCIPSLCSGSALDLPCACP